MPNDAAASVSNAAVIAAILARKKRWSWKNRMLAVYFDRVERTRQKLRRPERIHRNVRRNRGFALSQMDRLPNSVFKRMFRVDRATFDEVLETIDPFLEQRKAEKAINSSGSPISNKTRLAVTLRWLAGGSYIDLCFAWGVGVSTFYSDRGIIWPTIEAIDFAYEMGLPLHDNQKLEELSQGFFEHSGGIFDGCVLAIDGFAVITRQPYDKEVRYKKDYRYRKGGFAVVVLAGCDVKCRFIIASCNHSGSTNDIIAWQHMELFEAVELDKALPPKYFFIGDEAFTNSNQFLSPWPGRGLDRYKDSFNYWLSHSRQTIERSFGILTQRWGIFWRAFTFSFHRWSMVIMVCMRLHNLCIDRNDEMPNRRFYADIQQGDEWRVYDNVNEDDIFLRGHAMGDRRCIITNKLQQEGVVRPAHAQCNSRM